MAPSAFDGSTQMTTRLTLLALIAAMLITAQQTRPVQDRSGGSQPAAATSLDVGER